MKRTAIIGITSGIGYHMTKLLLFQGLNIRVAGHRQSFSGVFQTFDQTGLTL